MNDYNLDDLKTIGTDYFRTSLFPPVEEVLEYTRDRIPLAVKRDGNIWYYDLKGTNRCIFIGPPGSGKTYSMRSFADRLDKAGYHQVFLPDVKDEFKSSRNLVQNKFRKGLLRGEKPAGLKIVTLRPTFFKPYQERLAKYNFYYSPNPNSLTRNDFMTLMNADEMTSPQKTVLELLYEDMRKNNEAFDILQVESFIDNLSEITTSQKTSLKLKFKPLTNSQFYIKEYDRDIIKMLRSGYTLSFNMEGFDNFGKGSFSYPEVTVGLVLRKIINARRNGMIGPVWVHVDETSRFAPVNRNPSCKDDFIQSAQLDRRYELYYSYAVQSLGMIPEPLVSACRYVFVPSNVEPSVIKEALEMTGVLRNSQVGTNQALQLKREMRKKPHSWAVFDKVLGTIDIIQFLSPLSWHMEAGE